MSFDDFVISYFTAGSATSTLAMTIYGMTKKRITPEINAISTLLFVTVLVLLLAVIIFRLPGLAVIVTLYVLSGPVIGIYNLTSKKELQMISSKNV